MPRAIFSSTKPRYSGRALTNMPMNEIYDVTNLLSIAVQGIFMIAFTNAE